MKQYSTSEAADLLGMHRRDVRQAIRDGELEAEADGRGYLIERADLEDFAEEQGIELNADDLCDEERAEAAMEEHRPSWEAGFRSGFAAGAQESEED